MKNVFTKILILFLGSSLGVMAQNDSKFRFGIHGTPTISYIATDDPDYETSSKLKFNFGLIGEYYFAEHYAIASGITVANRGAEVSYVDLPDQLTGDRTLVSGEFNGTFLQVPIKLKMTTREFGYFTGFAEFGGELAFNIDEKVNFEPAQADVNRDDDYVNLFNAVFNIGIGTEYNLGGNTSLIAGLYYNRSLIDNLEDDLSKMEGLVKDKYEYRFDYVSLRVGVLF